MDHIYLDHNSTTFLREEARRAWLEVTDALVGNASSLHLRGRQARDYVDRARERTAAALGVREDEVVFTSGGTEANNLALLGALGTLRRSSPGSAERGEAALVTTTVEHSSVLGPAEELERTGTPLLRLGVDSTGQPDLDQLEDWLTTRPVGLVSVGAANNEVGVVPPLARIGELLRRVGGSRAGRESSGAGAEAQRPLFHTDAVQALGRIPVDLDEWGVDLAAFSAHKVGGPVGVGVLVRRRGAHLEPVLHGGGQEHGLRPGTEDAAGIVAASVAVELAVAEREQCHQHTAELVQLFWSQLADRVPGARVLGPDVHAPNRLPNTINVALPEADGRILVTRLDLEGLHVSAGSACASGSLEPSHVLRAMGVDDDVARAGLRVSFGRTNTRLDCKVAVEILAKVFSTSRAT